MLKNLQEILSSGVGMSALYILDIMLNYDPFVSKSWATSKCLNIVPNASEWPILHPFFENFPGGHAPGPP